MAEVLTRRAAEDDLTFEAVLSAGTEVQRTGAQPDGGYGLWRERLSPAGADLSRLLNGAPLLLDHVALTSAQVGVVESARLADNRILVSGRFSHSAKGREIHGDVKGKIRRQLSVGYEVKKWRRISPESDPNPIFEAVSWLPLEASVVAIGADAVAQFRSHNPEFRLIEMSVETSSPAAEGSSPPLFALTDQRKVESAELARCSAILEKVERFGLPISLARQLIDKGATLEQAKTQMIDARAARQDDTEIRNINYAGHGTGYPGVTGGADHAAPDSIRQRLAGALAHRLSNGLSPLPEASREFRGCSLLDMGREMAAARGIRLRSNGEVAGWLTRSGGYHTTSDFALLMGDASNRALLDRFQRLTPVLTTVARRTTAPDYRLIHRIRVGEGPALLEVREHGEVERGTTGEEGESYAVRRYARIIAFSRKLIVNDDLNGLQDFLNGAADAAAGKLGDVLADVLLLNAALSDGVPLWHSVHGNTAAGAAISVASLSAARLAMRSQRGVDGTPIQVVPRFLVVGPTKETEAEQVLTTLNATATGETNPFAGKLELVVEPRITGTKWFLFSEPAVNPVLEYAELDGTRPMSGPGPQVDTREGFEVEGLEIKTAYDVGAAAIGWRGAFYSPGA